MQLMRCHLGRITAKGGIILMVDVYHCDYTKDANYICLIIYLKFKIKKNERSKNRN